MRVLSRTAALIVAAFLTFLVSSSASSQEPDKGPPFGEGTHALRAILNKLKLEPIKSEKQFRDEVREGKADEILVIVLGFSKKPGDRHVLDRVPDTARAFLNNGGALLAATDKEGGRWWEELDVRLDGSFVQATQPGSKYRDSADCPFVRPRPAKTVPVFDGLNRVATNRPQSLSLGRECPLIPLAFFPRDCTFEGLPAIVMRGIQLPFAAGGTIGDGRMLLFADHSMFINDMLLQNDNDNFDLACSAVGWLTEDGKRTRVLFVEDGEVVTNFNVILKEAPLPPLPPLPPEAELVHWANQSLVNLEREDFFNRTLLDAISPPMHTGEGGRDHQVGRARLLQGLLVLMTAGLFLFGCHRLMRARHRIDRRVPPAGPELWPASVGMVMEQRQQALLQTGNLWEPARALARQFFEGAADFRPEQWTAATPPPPRLTVADAGRRRVLERQVRDLWRLATAAVPCRVSAVDFEHLLARLQALQADCATGALKFSAA